MRQRPQVGSRERPGSEGETTRDPATCPECSGQVVRRERSAETVCADCGLVVTEAAIDRGPEWRAFNDREKAEKSRVGAPTTQLLHDKGLSTTIGWRDEDAHGRSLSARKRKQLRRLRTWNERFRSQGSKDRNLKHALGEIDRMASGLGIPRPTRETASVIYRRALDEGLLPGRSVEGVATVAIYAASRLDGVARTIDEVAAVSRVDELEIERTYRHIVRELSIQIPPTHPSEYVGRFASDLGCTDETERRARELIATATEQGVHSGKHPVGIAASALYAAGRLCNDQFTQAEVSAVSAISKVTIRNRYREVLEAADAGDPP
ncbi:MAG: TFIIB-type zinc ribbon-containing protein [Haloarculaceae archaeon]